LDQREDATRIGEKSSMADRPPTMNTSLEGLRRKPILPESARELQVPANANRITVRNLVGNDTTGLWRPRRVPRHRERAPMEHA
jgi:hypothetical protein